jgi:hypothetical protein
MTRYFDAMSDDTILFVITSNRVLCRRTSHQSIVSSHQTEYCVVAHCIKVSCHHIKQSVVSSLITSKYRVITSNSVVSSLITSKCRVITSNRVLCRRSLLTRYFDVMSDDTTLFDVMTRYFDVMSDDTILCLM